MVEWGKSVYEWGLGIWERIQKWPWVAHILRANARYSERFGVHFAASITYFTVMSIVPVLSFAFSMMSIVLIRSRPDLVTQAKDMVVDKLGGVGSPDKIASVIDQALQASGSWWTVAIAVGTAFWAGIGWVANLRSGIRMQWEDDLDAANHTGNWFLTKLLDAAVFLGLLVVFVVAAVMAQSGASLAGYFARLLHLDEVTGHQFFVPVMGIVSATIASTLLLLYLFATLTTRGRPRHGVLRGSLVAGFVLAAMQLAAGYLVGAFSSNRAVQLFGSVIVALLVLDLIAQIILFAAAWIGTVEHEVPDDVLAGLDTSPTAMTDEAPEAGGTVPASVGPEPTGSADSTSPPPGAASPTSHAPGKGRRLVMGAVAAVVGLVMLTRWRDRHPRA